MTVGNIERCDVRKNADRVDTDTLRQTNDVSRQCLGIRAARAKKGRSAFFTAPFASRSTDIKIQLPLADEERGGCPPSPIQSGWKLADFQADGTNTPRIRFPHSFPPHFLRARARNPRVETRRRGATERFSRCVCVSTYRSPIHNRIFMGASTRSSLATECRANAERETFCRDIGEQSIIGYPDCAPFRNSFRISPPPPPTPFSLVKADWKNWIFRCGKIVDTPQERNVSAPRKGTLVCLFLLSVPAIIIFSIMIICFAKVSFNKAPPTKFFRLLQDNSICLLYNKKQWITK